MTETGMTGQFADFLERSLCARGWLGRGYGARHWLRRGAHSSLQAERVSVVAIRRNVQPEDACGVFDLLKKDGLPFQGILVDVPEKDEGPLPDVRENGADVQLVLFSSAPWYTAFNLGAACASGDLLIFLDGRASPPAGLLAAYSQLFQRYPETLVARGDLLVDGLEDCDCPVPGAFALDPALELWPLDLDENMAARAGVFFELGGFDESLIGGYGALDFSIRLFGRRPDFSCQRHTPEARLVLDIPAIQGLPLNIYLLQRHEAWLQLNDSLKRYLELYGKFWLEKTGGKIGG